MRVSGKSYAKGFGLYARKILYLPPYPENQPLTPLETNKLGADQFGSAIALKTVRAV